MSTTVLAARRALLRRTQNPDGGWGYFAGKQSWMEPTAYAILALQGDPESDGARMKAWTLLKGWQDGNGGWKPAAHVDSPTWVTALGVTLCCAEGEYGRAFENGVRWLLRTTGAENAILNRIIYRVLGRGIGRDTSNRGWPWRGGTTAWVEPTSHSLVALKKASHHFHDREVRARIKEGEQLLLTVRTRDGGWNYGSPGALGVDLPSYPETTALALIGLQLHAPADYKLPVTAAHARLAGAWLSIAGAVLDRKRPFEAPEEPPEDLMIAALECVAAAGADAFRAEAA